MFLYDVGDLNFLEHLPMCIAATYWDAAIIAGIYLIFGAAFDDYFWIKNLSWKRALPVIVLGLFVALFIEERALYDGRWAYSELMPIVPFTHAGLSPVLQMMFLPVITFWLASKINSLLRTKN